MQFLFRYCFSFLLLVSYCAHLGAQAPATGLVQAKELYTLGKDQVNRDPDSARWSLRQAFDWAEMAKDQSLLGRSSRQIGMTFVQQTQFDSARHWYERSLAYRETPASKAYVWHDLSALFQRQGLYDRAYQYLSMTVKEREENGKPSQRGTVYHDLGLLCRNWANKQRRLLASPLEISAKDSLALYYLNKSLAIWEQEEGENGRSRLAFTLASRVPVLLDLGRMEEALESAQRCQQLYLQLADTQGQARGLFQEGRVHQEQQQYNRAAARYLEALRLQPLKSGYTRRIWTLNNLAMVYIEQEQFSKAEFYILRAKHLLDSLPLRTEQTVEVYETWSQYLRGREHFKAYANALLDYQHLRDSLLYDLSEITPMESQLREQQLKDGLKLAEQERFYERWLFVGLLSFLLGGLLVWRHFQKQKQQQEKEAFQEEVLHRLRSVEQELYASQADKEAQKWKRLGREIHDNVGGELIIWQRQMEEEAERFRTNWTEDHQRFHFHTVEMLQKIYQTVRTISHELEGNKVEENQEIDIILYLRELEANLGKAGYKVNLYISGLKQVSLTPKISYGLARICQEAIANIVKHAEAKTITIQLLYRALEQELSLTIEDDGVGFDYKNIEGGIGLISIEKRVHQLEGVINFDSNLGSGASLLVQLPA